MKCKCPHCGNKINIKVEPAGYVRQSKASNGAAFESSQKLHNAVPIAAAPPPGIIRETPAYLPTQEAHVTVPLLQSLIGGVFTGSIVLLSSGAILVASDAFTAWGVGFYSCISGGVAFLLASAWVWSRRVGLYDELLWKIEEQTGLDLNRDDHTGKPEPQMVRVEMRTTGAENRWQFANIPVEAGKLRELALNLRRGDSFAERTAKDAGLSQEEFRALRNIFVDRGWAAWNHPTVKQQGVSLTRGGEFIIRQMASASVPEVENSLSEQYELID